MLAAQKRACEVADLSASSVGVAGGTPWPGSLEMNGVASQHSAEPPQNLEVLPETICGVFRERALPRNEGKALTAQW